jgi:hypothetical protein
MIPSNNHKSRSAVPPISPWEAWVILKHAQSNPLSLNGECSAASPRVQKLLKLFAQLPTQKDRIHALQGFNANLEERDRQTLQNVDLKAGEPSAEPAPVQLPARSPRLDSLIDPPDGKSRFLWKNRLVRGHLNIVSSNPKIGKTTLFLEFSRRLWLGTPFPDEEELILPAKTITLWVCGDRHHDELKERASLFGIPHTAIALCAWPHNPYGNCSFDIEDTIKLLEHYIINEHPGIIFIDTIWRATTKKMKLEEEVNELFDPILEIAQKTNSTIFGASHLSKEGETLGRRLECVARSVMKLYQPDPENQPDRRKLTTMGNCKQPDDLGMTIYEDRIEFDHSPPQTPKPERKGGRPRTTSDRAIPFILEMLEYSPQEQKDIEKRWVELGRGRSSLDRAKKELLEVGTIEVKHDESTNRIIWSKKVDEPKVIDQTEAIKLLETTTDTTADTTVPLTVPTTAESIKLIENIADTIVLPTEPTTAERAEFKELLRSGGGISEAQNT